MPTTNPDLVELDTEEILPVVGGTTPNPIPTFDIEQMLSIGSQSTGAGAGKITFNPFSISR
jgi:hypothetical protein